jgi:hypothetical protein
MNSQYNIFSVKPVVFEEGERDPFGFDDFAEKLGAEYLPFSGSVSKPSYFLFVAYVNYLFKAGHIKYKNLKEKNEFKIRLEKLLVYSWKKNSAKESLRGSNIIGNSYDINDIDPFSAKGWVKQNCFKIYTDNNFVPITLDRYLKKIGEKQIPLLKDFLATQYKQPKAKKDYLNEIIRKLKNKNSLFYNHRLETSLKQIFKKELRKKINYILKNNESEYLKDIDIIWNKKRIDDDAFFVRFLENKNLPFYPLNKWFGNFADAVDADIYDKSDRKKLWDIADASFESINEKFRSIEKANINLEKRQKPIKWIKFKNGKYCLEPANDSEKKRIKKLWTAYVKRQGEVKGDRYFFNYRHAAFLRILRELE